MAWSTQETTTIGGDTVVRQRADGADGDHGHRVVVNGTPGTAVPMAKEAVNGDYRGRQPEFDLTNSVSPTLYKAAESSFSGGTTATITADGGAVVGFNTSLLVATGNGDAHAWAFGNNAGAGGNDNFIDSGGGPSNDTLATRIKTRIDAVALPGVTVARANNVLTVTCAAGVVVQSTDAGAVVS